MIMILCRRLDTLLLLLSDGGADRKPNLHWLKLPGPTDYLMEDENVSKGNLDAAMHPDNFLGMCASPKPKAAIIKTLLNKEEETCLGFCQSETGANVICDCKSLGVYTFRLTCYLSIPTELELP
jgi:hypothetical protein